METLAHLTIRALVGLLFAGLLSFGGYIMSNMFVPAAGPDEDLLVNIRLAFVGAGAGVGALAGWSIRDESRPPMALIVVLAFAGGFVGAWAGLVFAEGSLDTINLWDRHLQITRTTIFSATAGANLLLLIAGGFTVWLRRGS